MSAKTILLAIATIVLLSFGQILFKYSSGLVDVERRGIIFGLFLNPFFLVALIIYGLATILWILVLREIPIKNAYPFASIAFVLVPIFSFFILGEAVRWTTFLGAIFIVIGVCISLL